MGWYHFALIGAVIIALLLAWKTPRARLWIGCIAVSATISGVYLHAFGNAGILRPTVIAFFCDAAVYLAIREFHKERWEMRGLGSLTMLSVIVNMLQSWGHIVGIPPVLAQEYYAVALEGIIYLQLLLIGGVGLMDRIAEHGHTRHSIYGALASRVHGIAAVAHRQTTCRQTLRKW